jgi:hypothetical protein
MDPEEDWAALYTSPVHGIKSKLFAVVVEGVGTGLQGRRGWFKLPIRILGMVQKRGQAPRQEAFSCVLTDVELGASPRF